MRKLNNITKTWFILLNFYESFNKFSLKQQFLFLKKFQELHEQLELENIHSINNQQNIKNIIKLDKSNEKFIRKITKMYKFIKKILDDVSWRKTKRNFINRKYESYIKIDK